MSPGLNVALTGSDDITAFNLIRLQATTHGVNSDSRLVPVPFTKTGTGQYSLAIDRNANTLPPGLYWIFALNANGTPSLGYVVRMYTPDTFPSSNPVVSIASPTSGTAFAAGTTINFAANVTDPDGNVARVEFFEGTTKLGEDTSAPYAFAWTNAPAGDHTITARAVDAGGLTSSVAVNVTVNGLSGSPARVLQSLKGAPVPEPSTLSSLVTNRSAAIAFGKAFFWDTQVSSDGKIACASCHFQAGADVRFKGQMRVARS